MMHTTLKNVEILELFKISKTAPTCFGLQGNHRQGATMSTELSTHLLLTKCVILAKYWPWFPDDGFLVNRNMLEQFPYFKMF